MTAPAPAPSRPRPPRPRPARVGLVGYGLAGSVFHAPLIAATGGMVLDTVVTAHEERRAQARAAHPGVRLAAAPEELWARADELDLVVVASPNKTHVPLASAALEAGLPVVVDKPVAGTAAQARALAALAQERGLLLSAASEPPLGQRLPDPARPAGERRTGTTCSGSSPASSGGGRS